MGEVAIAVQDHAGLRDQLSPQTVVTMAHLSQKFTLRAKRSPTSDAYSQKYEQLGSTVQSSLTIESSSIAKGGKCRRICFSRRI
jgi:hypothetical protein